MNNWALVFIILNSLLLVSTTVMLLVAKEPYLKGPPIGRQVPYALGSTAGLTVLFFAGYFGKSMLAFSIPQILMLLAMWPLRPLVVSESRRDELQFNIFKALVVLLLFFLGRP